jgi:hypothetical protein
MPEMAVQPEKCVHYWIIDPPDGPTSEGRCKYCGAVAEFFNDLQGCLNNTKSYILNTYDKRDVILDGDNIMINS